MGRLLRATFKLAVIGAVVGGIVAAARKLMGGLGPTPGSADAPREWPSLVPDPVTPAAAESSAPASNGTAPATAADGTASADTATPVDPEPPAATPAPEGPAGTEPTI